ncbi:PASTA domain-containing protein [Herbidospora sp. NEAU-GS84]|uniref:PASTA domain-containing protein n=1 Tax=Herbidospora solisilvae TaxID=2696284 RepID=A0A7C9JEU1_9ACTN|nr:PASTA domain-containing protein [Herbidospora solisilvae]NAS25484.1 PASTA domain-containing protein [Herbidospora solisilvae]
MNVEEALKEAMRAQVGEVYAPPSMGSAVRRRRRRSLVRFRTAGAVLVTAAVAVTVPVVLTNTTPSAGPASGASAPAIAVPGIVVPDVVGMNAKQAYLLLEQAGLTPMLMTPGEGGEKAGVVAGEKVIMTEPAAGTVADPKALVQIKVPWVPAPTVSPTALPEDEGGKPEIENLGDLGDGLTWMGIHVGYLPEGVKWGGTSYVGGFGKKSATVPYVTQGLEEGMYSVQVIVSADPQLLRRDGQKVGPATWVDVYDEGGGKGDFGPSATLTASRELSGDQMVQVAFSPDFSASLGEERARTEIVKVIEGIRPEK